MPNRDYLNELKKKASQNGATNLNIDNKSIEEYEKIKRDQVVNFDCVCGKHGTKNVRVILEKAGLYCKECTTETQQKKKKATNFERYGYEHPGQSQVVKDQMKATNIERHGCEYPMQSQEIRDKWKATNLKKLGCENPSQSPEVQEKMKATNMERLGCEYPFQSPEVRDKAKATNLKKLGYENPSQAPTVKAKKEAASRKKYGCQHALQASEVREKGKATNLKKLGCENPSQSQAVKAKKEATSLRRYGCKHHMHNKESFEKCQKACYKKKPYTFSCGNIVNCQGYEPQALQRLEETQSYSIDDYQDWQGREFWYESDDGKKHRYYPDIPFLREGKIIEVKGEYTFHKDYEKNLKKAQSVIERGLDFEFWIYNNNESWTFLDTKEVNKRISA